VSPATPHNDQLTADELLAVVDGILQVQAGADSDYFAVSCGRAVNDDEAKQVEACFLDAYRWQYIHAGAQHPRFVEILSGLIIEDRGRRIQAALATLH